MDRCRVQAHSGQPKHALPLWVTLWVALLSAAPHLAWAQNPDTPTAPPQDPSAQGSPKETVTHERLGISMTTPDGWNRLELTSNSRTVASFIHVQSQSLIEVVGTHLINRDVAKVFFGTFRDAIKSANFSEVMPPTAATLGSVSGEQSEYTFEHTGITLRVVIFSFVRDDAAFMLIGYFRNEERDLHLEALRQLAGSFNFT
jgi:hypothetical protein